MAGVLTTASNVTCGHSPGRVSTSSSAKLKVSGSAVLLKTGVSSKSVSGCSTVTSTDSNGVTQNQQCSSVSSVTAGEATKLKAGGSFVMLDTLAGQTDGMVNYTTPQTKLSATAGQTKLKAI